MFFLFCFFLTALKCTGEKTKVSDFFLIIVFKFEFKAVAVVFCLFVLFVRFIFLLLVSRQPVQGHSVAAESASQMQGF